MLKNRSIYLLALLAIIFLFVLGLFQQRTINRNNIDVLAQSDWTHVPGIEKIDTGLKIQPLGRALNHRDTSTAQPNPPINVRGSSLKVSGDFRVDMSLQDIQNEATVQLYGQIPPIYDEWRNERSSIRLDAKNNELRARVWDGSAANSIDERVFFVDAEEKMNVSLIHRQGTFIFQVNGRSVGSMPDHNVFADGKVWFGTDAKVGTKGWTLLALTARGTAKENVQLEPALSLARNRDNPESLRNLADNHPRKLPIGTAAALYPLLTDKKYNEIILGEFSMLTIENDTKPQFLQPQKGLFVFKDADTIVEAAEKNQMQVHGHALVMGKANPEWMQKSSENERKQIMIDHVSTVVGHYKGKVNQWDVVNEPLSEDDVDYDGLQKGLRRQMWSDALGEEYIDIAFRTARAADPEAKLYLNDFGIERDGQRWDAFLSLVKRLRERDVPIDGVGFESHVYHKPADTIDPAQLKQHIQALASLGVVSRISEIDVLGDEPDFQSQQFSDVLRACLSEPTCTSYGIWGVTDLYGSTTLSDRYPVMLGDSLLWGNDYIPKPSMQRLQETLKEF